MQVSEPSPSSARINYRISWKKRHLLVIAKMTKEQMLEVLYNFDPKLQTNPTNKIFSKTTKNKKGLTDEEPLFRPRPKPKSRSKAFSSSATVEEMAEDFTTCRMNTMDTQARRRRRARVRKRRSATTG